MIEFNFSPISRLSSFDLAKAKSINFTAYRFFPLSAIGEQNFPDAKTLEDLCFPRFDMENKYLLVMCHQEIFVFPLPNNKQ